MALRANPISNGALAGPALPARLKILAWGVNDTATKGPVKVGANTKALLAANQAAMGFDAIALDYNHNSLPDHPNFQPDPRKVAAYGGLEVIEGDGIYLSALSYTPSGTENAREYRDLSPAVVQDETGEVIFIHSVALCPQGEVKGLSFYAVDVTKALSAAKAQNSKQTTKTTDMDYKKLLCLMLGLDPASATDTEIEAAATKFGEQEKTEPEHKDPEKPKDEKPKGDEPTEGDKKIEALSTEVANLAKIITSFTNKEDNRERDAVLADAMREGKVVPLSVRKLPIEHLRAVVKDLPTGVVPLEQRTPEHIQALSAGEALPDTQGAELDRLLGITPEMKTRAATRV